MCLFSQKKKHLLRSSFLLFDHGKQWHVANVNNKKVSAIFEFSKPIEITKFNFATYNGGSIGVYNGWNLYYKNNNDWIKCLDYNDTTINIRSIGDNNLETYYKLPFQSISNEWKFEVLPTKKVYFYCKKEICYILKL